MATLHILSEEKGIIMEMNKKMIEVTIVDSLCHHLHRDKNPRRKLGQEKYILTIQ